MKLLIILSILVLVSCRNDGASYSIQPTPIPTQNCTVINTPLNTIIMCPDGSTAVINNVVLPYTPVSVITPCGANSSPFKEIILCMFNGDLIAVFSDNSSGQNTRLSLLDDGNFVDTDSSGCNFHISSLINSSVNTLNPSARVVSWGAGSNSYATWSADSNQCLIH